MDEIHVVLVSLLLSVVVLGTIARLIRVPYPIVLVVGGLVLGFVPGLPARSTLDPDLVLVDLPAAAAVLGGLLRQPARPPARTCVAIALLAIGLVLVTMVARSRWSPTQLVDGMPWAAAFALGAIVSPTDPLAPTHDPAPPGGPAPDGRRSSRARACSTTAPRSSPTGSALEAVGVGVRRSGDAAGDFVVSAAGGIGDRARGRLGDRGDPPAHRRHPDRRSRSRSSAATPGYLPAEELGVSGVLAAVTTGIVLGWKAPEISTASMRLQGYAVWEILDLPAQRAAVRADRAAAPDRSSTGSPASQPADAARLAVGGQRVGDP